jgi:hypothetical protein
MQGGKLIVYGCMSGKPLMLPWQQWVFDGIDVSTHTHIIPSHPISKAIFPHNLTCTFSQ